MPYEEVYVPSEILVDLGDQIIYYAYKDNAADEPMTYWYTPEEDAEDSQFDVRELPGYSYEEEEEAVSAFPETNQWDEREGARRAYHVKVIEQLHEQEGPDWVELHT